MLGLFIQGATSTLSIVYALFYETLLNKLQGGSGRWDHLTVAVCSRLKLKFLAWFRNATHCRSENFVVGVVNEYCIVKFASYLVSICNCWDIGIAILEDNLLEMIYREFLSFRQFDILLRKTQDCHRLGMT